MNQNTITKIFASAAVALALCAAPAAKAADKGCSNATLRGTFAFRATGSHFPPTGASLLAVLFAQTFDGSGGLTSTGLQSDNGTILQVSQTGTYTVNPDCTGTYTVLLSPLGFTIHFYFVIADGVNQLEAISMDPNTVLAGTARRQFLSGDWRYGQ
jgi:hypothetical protein